MPTYDDYDAPLKRRSYRCRGWAEYSGPCGAEDCSSCYPGNIYGRFVCQGCGEEIEQDEERCDECCSEKE